MIPLAARTEVDWVSLSVLILLFAVVTVLGFMATRFKKGDSLDSLDEWGLGGRKFGTWVTWFLLGGDLYTAYTFIAVPAAMFAMGSVAGFFAVPYTIILYPIIFIFMARLWSVSHRHGYVTTADFVQGRYDSRVLSLAVAVTGFVATMPYIALQLVGIQAVLDVVGLGGGGNWFAKDLPLLIAFVLLAAYTYTSGLRAPAVIAFVKDALIYLVIIVAIIYLPTTIDGGWDGIFGAAKEKMAATNEATGKPNGAFIPASEQFWAYGTLALGSAMALFMYPHSVTATLSSESRVTIRRNASILPAYSFVLGLLALLGWVAIAAGTEPIGVDGKPNPQLVIPQLFEDSFSELVRGRRVRGGGHRRPGAGGDHVDRCGEHLHAQHLQGVDQARGDPCPGGTGLQDRVARGQGVRADVRADARPAERDQLPAPRRHLDPADVPGHRVQPLHQVVPQVGAAGRLGGRHGLRHLRGLQGRQPGHRPALRRLARRDPGPRRHGVRRVDRVRHQPRRSRSCSR